MTEAEWLGCTDPGPMLESLRGRASERKLRLFGVACCRRIWYLLQDPRSREAVEAAEVYADGCFDGLVLEAAAAAAKEAIRAVGVASEALEYAATAAEWAADWDRAPWSGEPAAVAAGLAAGEGGWEKQRREERARQCDLLRDLVGNPFRPVSLDPAWGTPDVLTLARAAYENRTLPAGTLEPARLALLADALTDAGCTNPDLLDHLRGEGPHVRGCWVVDLVLGKQ